jgi:hypothetical protein
MAALQRYGSAVNFLSDVKLLKLPQDYTGSGCFLINVIITSDYGAYNSLLDSRMLEQRILRQNVKLFFAECRQ